LITYTRDVTGIGYGTASGGNPDLKPTTSKNFDAALEYYFDEASTINISLFKRKIDGLIVDFRRRVTYTDATGPYDYILSQPENASNGDLQGVEIGGKYYPKNLPSVLNGFGVEASYTHLKSSQDVPITNGLGQVTGTYKTQFYSVSPDSYSVTLAYEKSKFSGRLSYAWRSAFFHNPEAALFANPLYIYDSAQRSVNAQLSYKFTKDFVISIEGTNLTNDIMHSYYGKNGATTNNFGNWLVGRTFSLSTRYSF
jgi:TonB-dependent receptor